jgi:hypothetical protein
LISFSPIKSEKRANAWVAGEDVSDETISLASPIKHIASAIWQREREEVDTRSIKRIDVIVSFQKIATTSQRLLQFILLCSCAILINTLINKWFAVATVPLLVIYYLVQKFYRESTR